MSNTLFGTLILVNVIKESENEGTDIVETLNELLQEKLTDVYIDWSHQWGKFKRANNQVLSENESLETKKAERHWYEDNRKPHPKTNANANQSKKWVLIQKCLDTEWEIFSEIWWKYCQSLLWLTFLSPILLTVYVYAALEIHLGSQQLPRVFPRQTVFL